MVNKVVDETDLVQLSNLRRFSLFRKICLFGMDKENHATCRYYPECLDQLACDTIPTRYRKNHCCYVPTDSEEEHCDAIDMVTGCFRILLTRKT